MKMKQFDMHLEMVSQKLSNSCSHHTKSKLILLSLNLQFILALIQVPKSELSITSKMAKQLSSIGLVEKRYCRGWKLSHHFTFGQLFGDPSSQQQIRSNICNYIESNEADFKSFLDENDESFKTYGTNLELVAASRL